MQKPEEKRRCSILKKRRSRSLSPISPAERTARRASRRISFSGKHNVREFFGNENTAIVWGETYDVSADKHASSSNEQITLQSTRMSSMSATLQITRNDSSAMDISSINAVVPSANDFSNKHIMSTRSSTLRHAQTFSEDQKENIPISDDTELMELSVMLPAPPQPKPLLKPVEAKSNSMSRITMFDFSKINDVQESPILGERTSGSDNMDISGIEPSLNTSQETDMALPARSSGYTDWLKQNNFIDKSKATADNRRQTINQSIKIQLDTSHPVVMEQSKMVSKPLEDKRKTINQSFDMSFDVEKENEPVQSSIHNSTDMSIQVLSSEVNHLRSEVQYPPPQNIPHRRQTTHQVQDIDDNISLESPKTNTDPYQRMDDMSLDSIHWSASPLAAQNSNLNLKKSTAVSNRKTIHEPSEMSFDTTCKTNAQSLGNETVLSSMAMELQSTTHGTNQWSRKSVICKSPSKNVTSVYDNSEEIEVTKGLEQNSLYLSYHPLHSTKLNDVNNTKFDVELDASAHIDGVENDATNLMNDLSIHEPPIEEDPQIQQRKSVQIFNQTSHTNHFTLDISEDSPLPTSKKYNLNKTPFYLHMDKENYPDLIEPSNSSSLDLTNTSTDLKQSLEIEQMPQINEPRRGTVLFHATIGNDTELETAHATNMDSVELIDISNDSIVPEPVVESANETPKMDLKTRKTILSQSIVNLTPILNGDSFKSKIVMNESPIDSGNQSNSCELSKQLTFIEDDDEDDQLYNTKLDLVASSDTSEINDFVDRRGVSITNLSRFSLHSAVSDASIKSIPQMPEMVDTKELDAFRKSSRLRHSNVFDGNTTEEINYSAHTDETPNKMVSLAHINRSSIMQRRSSVGTNSAANESSYLLKGATDIPLSKIKLDFSGYEKLVGLATPEDVFKDFCNRMEQIQRKARKWEEDRKKLENGEINSLDPFSYNDEELVSQNVEAPSWTFLYKNKMKWEEEQRGAEIDREWEQRPVGAFLPAIPDISILLLNKCRMLNHWIFDDIWFFQGNIHLRSKLFPVYKICLIYDPNVSEQSIETYGALEFKAINQQYCPIHLEERTYSVFRLEVSELKSKLPKNLLPMCETSAHLSDLDDKLHEYCLDVQKKVAELHKVCRKNKALLKEENGMIYIIKTMFDFENHIYQDYIIELNDIDCTEWRNVRTNPRRVLNESIKHLPKGLRFIKELLKNDTKYIPMQ